MGEEGGAAGGDHWSQTGPYQQDLLAAFRQAQALALAGQGGGFEGRSIEDLWADPKWWEYIATGGTGSVVDQYTLLDPDADEVFATMRPLTRQEVLAWAPDGRPTPDQWADAERAGSIDYPARGCGRCTVLYRDGEPVQIVYWGVTAD